MTKTELEKRVEELEQVEENLRFELEWQKVMYTKRLLACAPHKKAYKRGTHQRKTNVTPKPSNRVKDPMVRDCFGQRLDTKVSQTMNMLICRLIEKGRYSYLSPDRLSQMTGGTVTPGRFREHLNWLKRQNYL